MARHVFESFRSTEMTNKNMYNLYINDGLFQIQAVTTERGAIKEIIITMPIAGTFSPSLSAVMQSVYPI